MQEERQGQAMATPRIFVSHSHHDNEWCTQLVDALTRAGFDVWFDKQGLYVGDQWVSKLETELEGRDVFLVVLTPDAWGSKWVRRELQLAIHQDKRILGIKQKPVELSGFITMYQSLDAVGQDAQRVAQQIAETLGVVVTTAPTVPPSAPVMPRSAGASLGPRTNGLYMAQFELGGYWHALQFESSRRGESLLVDSEGVPLKRITDIPPDWQALQHRMFHVPTSGDQFEIRFFGTKFRFVGTMTSERDMLELDTYFDDVLATPSAHLRYRFTGAVHQ
jgi:hypothetical protein